MHWLSEIKDNENFLVYYDLLKDIEKQLDLDEGMFSIGWVPIDNIIFSNDVRALPSVRDKFLELRLRAIERLSKEGIINDFEHKKNNIVYQSKTLISCIDKEELAIAIQAADSEYNIRKIVLPIGGKPALERPYSSLKDDGLRRICSNFHKIALQLRSRRRKRDPFEIKDEYDVQDILQALAYVFYKDIRDEHPTGQQAGSRSDMDFLIPEIHTIVEAKMTRDSLTNIKLKEEILRDIKDCSTLVPLGYKKILFFIYDPEHRIKNAVGFIKDLSESAYGLDVEVFISPDINN